MKTIDPRLSTRKLARDLGIARSMLYYRPVRPKIDEEVKLQIQSVLVDHPSYGHKRIALALRFNKKRILRVMKKFGIRPAKRRIPRPAKPNDLGKPNESRLNITRVLCPIVPDIVWASDFTYIRFRNQFIYLATVMDIWTREIVGWNVSRFHNAELVLGALNTALNNSRYVLPRYLHSDRGSEYEDGDYRTILAKFGIIQSFSDKSSPWHNAYQESFFSRFKLELGDPDRFEQLGELVEDVYKTINYYNTKSIHGKLKTTPFNYKESLNQKSQTNRS